MRYLTMLLLLVLAACAPSVQAPAAEPPPLLPLSPVSSLPLALTLSPEETALTSLNPPGTGSSATLSVGLNLHNSGTAALRLERLQYTLLLGDSVTVTGESDSEVRLEPGERLTLTLELTLGLQDNPAGVRRLGEAFNGSPLELKLDGQLEGSAGGVALVQPFELSGTVYARTALYPPNLSLNVAESRINNDGSVRLVLEVQNPGGVGYLLYAPELLLLLETLPVALSELAPTAVPALETVQLELRFLPDVTRLSAAAREVLTRGGLLELRGVMQLDAPGVASLMVPAEGQLSGVVARR